MSVYNDLNICSICFEKYPKLVPFNEVLHDCEDFTVAEVLQYLQFLSILDPTNIDRRICFICVSKIQSCFEFKKLCGQIQNVFKFRIDKITCESSVNIKEEKIWENDMRDPLETPSIHYFNVVQLNEQKTNEPKRNIDFGENICTSNADVVQQKPSHSIEIETNKELLEVKKENPPHFENTVRNYRTYRKRNYRNTPETFICSICQKGFKRKYNLKKHILIHTGAKPYTCDICGKSFRQSGTLRTHKLIHTKQRRYTYHKRSVSKNANLRAHNLGHSSEKNFCEICDKSFTTSGNLTMHKLIHTGERPFVCEFCNRSFTQAGNLATHRMIHTGEKPFVCEICDKCFRLASTLKNHKLLHINRLKQPTNTN